MKQVLRFVMVLACSVSCSLLAAPKPVPPNLVFLLVDDLRWNALGFMGDKIVQTPHLDRLAAKSVVFDNCFVTTSICSVSRASIFTGQWMRRHGIEDFAKGLNGTAWDKTYPAQLRTAGFRTGFALMAAQRHARIIGLFVRLLRRDGKPDYLIHLPRVWRMFERALQHEAVAPLRAWVDRLLPPELRRIGAGT